MPDLTATQWGFSGLIVLALLASVIPWSKIKGIFSKIDLPDLPEFGDDPKADLMELMGAVVDLQAALEARGHVKEAESLGAIYPLLRTPIKENEP